MRVYGAVVFAMAFGLWCYLTWRPGKRPPKDQTAQWVLVIALWPVMVFFIVAFLEGRDVLYPYGGLDRQDQEPEPRRPRLGPRL